MSKDTFDAGKWGAVVALPFGVLNAAANQTNADIAGPGADGNVNVVMPVAGSIVGISVQASAPITAGTVTFRAAKAGTEFPQNGYPAPQLSIASPSKAWASVRPGMLPFEAGDAIGVSYSSSSDAEPASTNDYSVLLWVQLDPN